MSDKKEIIYNCGKEMFEKKGFKDTNVAEIMKQAGMSTGTFYNYFTSKDKLFMEIYNHENVKLKSSMLASVNMKAEPIAIIREMMMKNLQGMMANPILREWYNRDVFQKIEQNFSEEGGLEMDSFYAGFVEVIRGWRAEGKMRADISEEMIMAIFATLVNVETHKSEIGLQYFPEVMDYLMEFTMKGLMINEEQGKTKEKS